MKKNNKSNDKVLYALIAAISVSLVATIFLYAGSSGITGFATTGIANLTIETITEINFTVDNINFGTGYVSSSCNNCTMDSEGGIDSACCLNFHGETDGFTIENIGNTNVTLNVSFAKDADTLLGGNSAVNGYQMKASNNAVAPGCVGTLSHITYSEIASGTSYTVCDDFGYKLNTNKLDVDIKVIVPENSKKGTLSDTITATATAN